MVTQVTKKCTIDELKGGVLEQNINANRRKRIAVKDHMAAFLGKNELLEWRISSVVSFI